MTVRPISRGLPHRDPQPSGWWCTECRERVEPDHRCDKPTPEDAA